MNLGSRILAQALAGLVALSAAGVAWADSLYGNKATAVEIAQLPRYCYAQYVDDKLSGDPKYSIQGCGYGMNHFCPALVFLMRAKKPTRPKGERREALRMAKQEIKYTIDRITPECWLRSEVEAAMQSALIQEKILK